MGVRLPLMIVIGLALILVMFYGLSKMVSAPIEVPNRTTATKINFTMMQRNTKVRTRQRVKPKRIPPPKHPHVKVNVAQQQHNTQMAHVPSMIPSLGLGGVAGGNAVIVGGMPPTSIHTTRPIPIVRVQPIYPRAAKRNHIHGQVIVAFTITRSGSVTNISIVKAVPPGVFNQATIRAVKQWRYQPRANPIRARVPISFNLGN